jgi:hypothetical protein
MPTVAGKFSSPMSPGEPGDSNPRVLHFNPLILRIPEKQTARMLSASGPLEFHPSGQ